MKLAGKVALVTGGARGIGRAIVERYIAEGASVAIADLSAGQAREAAEKFGDKARGFEVNVASCPSIDEMVASVVSVWGGIDILVNNAAVFVLAPIAAATEACFRTVSTVYVKGLFFSL